MNLGERTDRELGVEVRRCSGSYCWIDTRMCLCSTSYRSELTEITKDQTQWASDQSFQHKGCCTETQCVMFDRDTSIGRRTRSNIDLMGLTFVSTAKDQGKH